MPSTNTYRVIRDSREKPGQGWTFGEGRSCSGTIVGTLPTGDYTIEGHEADLCIERKGSLGEWVGNLYEPRMECVLKRMKGFRFAYLVAEFTLADLLRWPDGAGLPASARSRLRVKSGFAVLKRTQELELAHPGVRFVYAGPHGREFAASLFKRVAEAA